MKTTVSQWAFQATKSMPAFPLTPEPFEILETDPQSHQSGLPTDKQSSRSIGGMAERDIVDNESADGSTAELLRRLESRATTTTTTTTRRRRYVAYVGMV